MGANVHKRGDTNCYNIPVTVPIELECVHLVVEVDDSINDDSINDSINDEESDDSVFGRLCRTVRPERAGKVLYVSVSIDNFGYYVTISMTQENADGHFIIVLVEFYCGNPEITYPKSTTELIFDVKPYIV